MAEPKNPSNSHALPLVIISGLGAPKVSADAYGLMFRGHGFPVYTAHPSFLNFGDIREAARRIGTRVEQVLAETGARKVNLVGMSLGGLTGLYYVKCAGGAEHVARFVSVGGPLNGTKVANVSDFTPLRLVKALHQTRPDSDVIAEIRSAPVPNGVKLYSLGAAGDVMTPPASRAAEGFEIVDAPHGIFPIGHWCLFLHPGNVKPVLDLLEAPPAD